MITYTYKELKDFVLSLPDDKILKDSTFNTGDSCGCLLVEFGKSKNWDFESVGMVNFWKDALDEKIEAEMVASPKEEDYKNVRGMIESFIRFCDGSTLLNGSIRAKVIKDYLKNKTS